MVNPRGLLLTPPAPPGISLPGLIAASARLNVLGDVKSTLRSIGLSPARPGCISVTVQGREEALAARLGCAVSVVSAAATPPLDPSDTSVVRWGDGSIRRSYLVTRTRRISPAALKGSPHHRAAWSNALLDYCPESLDLLVDRCRRCGRTQRWLAAQGIECCDEPGCGALEGSGEVLPEGHVDGYRLFAGICSPVPAERRFALTRLVPDLMRLEPITLTEFAIKIGLALEGVESAKHSGFEDLSSDQRSRAASRGAMALLDWPLRLRSEVRSELESRGLGDGLARRRLRNALLSAGRSIRGGPYLRELLANVMPEIDVEVGRSFAGLNGPRVLGSVAARRLGTSHARLRHLAEIGIFAEEGVVDGRYRRALYDADQIDAASEAWRQSFPIEILMRRTALPRYACERIVGADDCASERHPFVLSLEGGPRIRSEAITAYLAFVRDGCRSGHAPADAVPLFAAMKMIGGRLKPWRQMLHLIGNGQFEAWLNGSEGPLVRQILVRCADIERFAMLEADEGVAPLTPMSDRLSQIDAMGVLNLGQIEGPRLAEAGLLNFSTGGRSLLVRLDEVLKLACAYVATAEAAARLRQTPSAAWHRVVRELGPPESPAGWNRRRFDGRFGGLSGLWAR